MDVNGTKFHLLLGQDDWSNCTVDGNTLKSLWSTSPPLPGRGGLEWNDQYQDLRLNAKLVKYIASPKDVSSPEPQSVDQLLAQRRGAGRDSCGNWYWIDQSKNKILVLSTGSGATSNFWYPGMADKSNDSTHQGGFAPVVAPAPPEPLTLSGLAVTEDHYLIVGTLDPGGLLIFDLHSTGEPLRLIWPEQVPFSPFDLAPRPGGGVWILDRQNRLYWAMDKGFNLVTRYRNDQVLSDARDEDFQPLAPGERRQTPARTFPHGISLDLASPLALHQPIAIEALPDGTVLILDYDPAAKFSQIYRYDYDIQLGAAFSTEVMQSPIKDQEFSLIGYDLAVVPEHDEAGIRLPDRLYVASAEGNQSFAFNLCHHHGQLVLTPVAEFFPMRLFGGKGLVAAGHNAWYDFSDRWVPLIRQSQPRYVAEAVFMTPPFDGREPDCVWHRLMLDANIPPDTNVIIRSRAANDLIDLDVAAWQPEPAPYLRGDGSELPFLPRRSTATAIGEGTWEFLFQQSRGRFLQLEITLTGNERTTPRLRALRAYYPRFSYLSNYLPTIYREDLESSSFLDRFLSNQEGQLTTLEDKIAAVQILFDVRSTPQETLDWLAGWLGVALDPAWDEARRRLFITHAMDFFQARGTVRGLKMALRLALDSCADERIFIQPESSSHQIERICIVERFLTRQPPGVVFGDPTELETVPDAAASPRWDPRQGRTKLFESYTD
ncbi:MAG: phage tail protein, partial [Blastocatellia bacterium]